MSVSALDGGMFMLICIPVTEMYSFVDKDKNKLFLGLRPDGTIGCIRAAIMGGLARNRKRNRLWYSGNILPWQM